MAILLSKHNINMISTEKISQTGTENLLAYQKQNRENRNQIDKKTGYTAMSECSV